MHQQPAEPDRSTHAQGNVPHNPMDTSASPMDADTLDRIKSLKVVQDAAYKLAKTGNWEMLEKLCQRMIDRRARVGDEFLAHVANYRPSPRHLTILQTMCAQKTPASLIATWIAFGADLEATAPVRLEFSIFMELERAQVTAFHLAAFTGHNEALVLLHKHGANFQAKTSNDKSAFHLLALVESDEKRIGTLSMLLKCGLNPYQSSDSQPSYFKRCLKRGHEEERNLLLSPEIVARYFAPGTVRSHRQKLLLGPLCRSFLRSLEKSGDTKNPLDLLGYLERFKAPSDRAFIQAILSRGNRSKRSKQRIPAMHLASAHQAGQTLIPRLKALGLDITQKARVNDVNGQTPLHVAANHPNPGNILALRKVGATSGERDGLGETAQEAFAKKMLFSKSTPPSTTLIADNIRLIFGGIEVSVVEAISLLKLNAPTAKEKHSVLSSIMIEDDELIDFIPFGSSFLSLVHHQFTPQKLSFRHHVLYRKAFHELAAKKPDSVSLSELLPALLTQYSIDPASYLARIFELQMDYRNDIRFKHPNLVELMALLNHPQEPDLKPERVGTLTSAITSTFRYQYPPNGVVIRNWATLGTLSFSFGFWKYDSMRMHSGPSAGNCLLEVYGFDRCPSRVSDVQAVGPHAGHHWFGPGFWLPPGKASFTYRKVDSSGKYTFKRFDAKTSVEFRRSYLMVSHPDHGTLIIRNSSRVFGRDLFDFPAYWSPQFIGGPLPDRVLAKITTAANKLNLTNLIHDPDSAEPKPIIEDELLAPYQKLSEDEIGEIIGTTFSTDKDEPEKPEPIESRYYHREFTQVLEPNLNSTPRVSKEIAFLIEQLMALKQDYAAWKYDTRMQSAWQDWDELGKQLVGGHLSPGFSALLDYLEDAFSKTQQIGSGKVNLPELAFVHPNYPPWSEYPYEVPTHEKLTRLKITEQSIQALRALANGNASNQLLEESGVRAFFQQAGLNTQGELVLLDPLPR